MHTPRLISSSSQRRLAGALDNNLLESPVSHLEREFVAIICPFNSGPGRGNITTVRRISEHLPASGCQVTTVALDSMRTDDQLALFNQSAPSLLHAFHAYHAGPTTRIIAQTLGIPYLITITGSDLFEAAMCSAPTTCQALTDASAVTCFDALVAQRLTEVFPSLSDKLIIIPQGVAALAVIEPFPRASNEFLILLPAPMRPVKGITNAIEALTPLAAEFRSLRLLLAGGPIDPEYAANIQAISARLPWVRLLGDVPHQQMGALYAAADLVLNSSFFEGGMANALLEAMVMGRPVIARDVVGNQSLVRHGDTGWLYSNDDELRELVRLMLLNPQLSNGIAEAGRNFVMGHCSPLTEASSYAALYQRLIR